MTHVGGSWTFACRLLADITNPFINHDVAQERCDLNNLFKGQLDIGVRNALSIHHNRAVLDLVEHQCLSAKHLANKSFPNLKAFRQIVRLYER